MAGKIIKLVIDTGASKNYIKPIKGLKGIIPVANPFIVKSIHGFTAIKEKCTINIFQTNSNFFILPSLSTFDGIIGLDLLTQTGATLNLKVGNLKLQLGSKRSNF